jgi:hypothetical protein
VDGAYYLVFAYRRDDGSLGPMDGPHSTFKIEDGVVRDWSRIKQPADHPWKAVRRRIERVLSSTRR